ncbi:MAG: hypothetical protein R3E61_00050 [Pseudomonadales bacterium]
MTPNKSLKERSRCSLGESPIVCFAFYAPLVALSSALGVKEFVFVLSKNFVAITAVISPRKFCKVAVIEKVSKMQVLESLLLPCSKMLRQKLRNRCV